MESLRMRLKAGRAAGSAVPPPLVKTPAARGTTDGSTKVELLRERFRALRAQAGASDNGVQALEGKAVARPRPAPRERVADILVTRAVGHLGKAVADRSRRRGRDHRKSRRKRRRHGSETSSSTPSSDGSSSSFRVARRDADRRPPLDASRAGRRLEGGLVTRGKYLFCCLSCS